MIDKRRAASVFGVSVLALSLFVVGVPVPSVVDDQEASSGVQTDAPTSTSVELQTTDPMLAQDADALACGGICITGVVALSAGTAGTVIGATYFSGDDPSGEDESFYMSQSLSDTFDADSSRLSSSYEATRTMAYRVAETSFAEAMANGSDKSDAALEAEEEVTQYLKDTIKDEFVRRNNEYVSSFIAAASADGATGKVITSSNVYGISGTSNASLHLWGDANHSLDVAAVSADGWGATAWVDTETYGTEQALEIRYQNRDTVTVKGQSQDLQTDLANYESIRSEVNDEIQNFTASVNESQYDNLSADEIVSPVNQALEWGESYNDTGSSGYASALASSLGYAVNETGTMYHVKMPVGSSDWYNGTVYADESTIPNGTIQTNTTYSGSNTTAYVATSSGTTTLDEDWEVVEIETRDGESLNDTSLSTWSRDSLNASAPLETLEKWQELQKETQSGGGIFGGGLFGGDGPLGVPWIAWLIGAVLVGAVVLGDD